MAVSLAGLGINLHAQTYDISSGGAPSITGAVGGSVTGSSSVLNNLSVTVNFGELSPSNTNGVVKIIVPVAVRSVSPYQVTAALTFTSGASSQAVQKTDVGFGMDNWRSLGTHAKVCTKSQHIIYSPFNNDPTTSITLSAAGRVVYASALADIGTSVVVLSGPRLTTDGTAARRTDNAYVFDAIFCVTPQFYTSGTTTATLTFTIGAGPNVAC
jgi:hypothetical protein